MRRYALVLLLSGCQCLQPAPDPVVVKIPVAAPCLEKLPPQPEEIDIDALKEANLYGKITLLLQELENWRAFGRGMLAVSGSCSGGK